MKRLKRASAIGATVIAAIALAMPANAALLDFVAEANGNERGVADGTTIAFGDVDVTFTSLGGSSHFAYFDDLSNGKPAGLGVCETLKAGPGSGCAVNSNDNVSAGDAVTLIFNDEMTVSKFSFSDADHNNLNANNVGTLLIAINDPNNFTQYTFTSAVALVMSGVTSIRFAFDPSQSGLDFYVNSFDASTPLPAAAPLLLAGLAGLSFASRRKRAT